jgi:hypothetical protein
MEHRDPYRAGEQKVGLSFEVTLTPDEALAMINELQRGIDRALGFSDAPQGPPQIQTTPSVTHRLRLAADSLAILGYRNLALAVEAIAEEHEVPE